MKKKLVIFLSLFILMCSFVSGCSTNNIKKIEIIEDSIKRNYIVGEEVSVNNFELKVTYIDEKEEYYYITDEKVKLNEINNSIVGEQKLNITFNYNNTDVNLQLMINFELPDDVKNIIAEIDELPELENLNFDYEIVIENIKEEYNQLSDFYKSYVDNYDKLISSDNYLTNLRNDNITTDFIEYRSNIKLSLTKYLNSLNKSDYYTDEWNKINSIYNYGISLIMNDNNYKKLEEIYATTIKNIKTVNTAYKVFINNLIDEYSDKLTNYRLSLNDELYSTENIYKLNLILNTEISKIKTCDNEEYLNKAYQTALNNLNSVLTIEQENKKLVLSNREKYIYELNIYYINIDFSKYSENNKLKIKNYYLNVTKQISNSEETEYMIEKVNKFKNYVNSVYTISEENKIIIENYRYQSLEYLKNIYTKLNLSEYSTKNRLLINNQYDVSYAKIENADSIGDMENEKNYFFEYVDSIPTMLDEAIENLDNRINSYKTKLNNIVSNYNLDAYSLDTISKINQIISDAENRMDIEIDVYTSDAYANQIINDAIMQINELLSL